MEMEEKKSCCTNKTTKRPEEELRKLGLPTDHYSKHKKKTL